MCACQPTLGFRCSYCKQVDEQLDRMLDSEPRESELWMLEPNGAREVVEPGITKATR